MASVALVVALSSAVPASAAEGLGTDQGWGLSAFDLFLYFVGLPILVFAVVIALVYGFSRNDEPRLREGQSWWTEPDFNTSESIGVQGASTAPTEAPTRTTDGGGTGARW